MMGDSLPESEGHLDPELFHRLLEADGDEGRAAALETATRHLASCVQCRRRYSDYRAAERTLRSLRTGAGPQGEPGANCPAEVEWARLAAGLLDDAQARRHVEHAARCDYCGSQLRQAYQDLAGELTAEDRRRLALLPSSQQSMQKSLAARLAVVAGVQRHGPPQFRRWWWAITAAAVVAIGIAGLAIRSRLGARPGAAEALLAQAYSSHREMELRIHGARYAPLTTERGAIGRPAQLPLLRAEVLIDRELSKHPANPAWLALEGRADLLEGRFQQAEATLEQALRLQPNSAAILTDLATAYFELAQQQARDDDYMVAAARLTDALKLQPADPVALFNRALVYEQIGSYPLAMEDWQRYLRIDSTSAWAKQVAEEHLDRLRKRVNAPPQSQLVPTLPAQAAAWLEDRINQPAGVESTSSSGEEQLLDVAVVRWLPDALQPSGKVSGLEQAAERTAVERLAAVVAQKHGDRWLADVLAAPHSAALAQGATALAAAIQSNAAGDPDAAVEQASLAEKLLRAAGDPAAALRARLELAYAFQRQENDEARCTAAARSALDSLGNRAYPWLKAQLLLELAAGEGMGRRFGAAQRAAQEAIDIARTSSYGTLYLRCIGFAGGFATHAGDVLQAWRWDRLGLEQYWAGGFPRTREYQFYSDMDFGAEAAGDWALAEALAREALGAIEQSPNRSLVAMARFRVAILASAAGDPATARKEFERSANIFATLPRDPAVETYQAWCQIRLANLEVQTGALDSALRRLPPVQPLVRQMKNGELALRFYRGLGEAYLANGDEPDAERALLAAVALAEQGLRSLTNGARRVAWAAATADAYRSLVRAELKGRSDPTGALGIWEWYRSGPVRVLEKRADDPAVALPIVARSQPMLPSSFSSNARKWILGAEPQLRRETVVSYAEFADGIEIWAFDDRGIEARWVPIPASELRPAARRFGEECAESDSDLARLRRDGQQLYQWLLAPVEDRLDPDRTLAFETDGVISKIPFPALVDSRGEYLGSRFAVVFSPGVGYERLWKSESTFSANDRVLAVGEPAVDGEWQTMLAPLPDADGEAHAVASDFHSEVVLSGKSATLPAVLKDLPAARIFHFAGHALAEGTRTGLVLASAGPADEEGAALLQADQLDSRQLRECRLAVLSACSTANAGHETLVDPESLVGAFLLAGVPDVVASRWNVNSAATAGLMEMFYRRLLAGDSVSRALQQAAETLRRNPRTAHPYYWAAFGVYGKG